MSREVHSLKEVFDEAQYVRVSEDDFVVLVWYGGPYFEAYRRSGRKFKVLDAYSVGRGDGGEVTQEQAEEAMEEHIERVWNEDYDDE